MNGFCMEMESKETVMEKNSLDDMMISTYSPLYMALTTFPKLPFPRIFSKLSWSRPSLVIFRFVGVFKIISFLSDFAHTSYVGGTSSFIGPEPFFLGDMTFWKSSFLTESLSLKTNLIRNAYSCKNFILVTVNFSTICGFPITVKENQEW